MTLDVQSYDPEADVVTGALDARDRAWVAVFHDVERARTALLDAAESGAILRPPPTLSANRFVRTVRVFSWVLLKRGVPPRAVTRSIPSFDPDSFLGGSSVQGWERGSGWAQLSSSALGSTTRAMSRLAPFVDPEHRESWTVMLEVLRDLDGRGQTLRCARLPD